MSDIVKRLRELADYHFEMLEDIHVPLGDAADEIERLREENERLRALARKARLQELRLKHL